VSMVIEDSVPQCVTRGGCLVAEASSFEHDREGAKAEQGSALVEYALVLIIFMTMLFGIIDFGRALYAYHFVSNAARDATRWAAVNGNDCTIDSSCNGIGGMNSGPASSTDVQNYVKALAIPAGINTSSTGCGGSACLTTTPTWNPAGSNGPATCSAFNNNPGCTVEVQVSYNFSFLFPLVYKNSITLSSTSEMVIAH
jgi:Flp pilus assembly protein TadG